MSKRRRKQPVEQPRRALVPPTAANRYEAYTPSVAIEDAAEQPPGNLRAEIAVVRAMLADLLKMDLAPDQRVRVTGELLAALVRLVRENRFVDNKEGDRIDEWTIALLKEEGVGMAARATTGRKGSDGTHNR